MKPDQSNSTGTAAYARRCRLMLGVLGAAAAALMIPPAKAESLKEKKVTVPWAPGCEFLPLHDIREPTEVSGLAPADDIVCYAIKPMAGSEISIEVVEGRNVIFSVSDLVDGVDRYAFRASGYDYRVNVGQLMRSASSEPYRIVFRGGESRKQRPESASPIEAGLRDKVMHFLGEGDALANLTPSADRKIEIKPVDLNEDGTPEALVIVRSRLDCGARGCAGYALDLSGPEAVSRGDFITTTLEAAESKTNGWRDILLNGQRFIYQSGKYVHARNAGAVTRPDGATVKAVQQNLASLGYDPGPIDGAYGGRTEAAIKAFLADRGLAPEAGITDRLIAALDAAGASGRGQTEPAEARGPHVPVTIPAGDGQMANCSGGVVTGLKPGGDGFLAVRAGPGPEHRMLDRLQNGNGVLLCDQRGEWTGIVYGRKGVYGRECQVEGAGPQRPYAGPCRSGWVHGRWIGQVAG